MMRWTMPALLLLCATAAADEPKIEAAAHWLHLRLQDSATLELQRDPPVQRWSGEDGALLHDAAPDARYRYRYRRRCPAACGDAGWSDWIAIVTPRAASTAPVAPAALHLDAPSPLRLTLRWTYEGDVAGVNGWLIERCDDAQRCEPAAIAHPHVRAFELVVFEASGYRIAAFNEHGLSAFTAIVADPLERDGIDPPLDNAGNDLTPADSIAAAAITVDPSASGSDDCVSPEQIEARGTMGDGTPMTELIGVRGGDAPVDVYRENDGCGANCVYLTYATVDGCYRQTGEVIGTDAPFSGRDERSAGLRTISQRGDATFGIVSVIEGGGDAIDQYVWCSPPHDPVMLRPPFDHYPCQLP